MLPHVVLWLAQLITLILFIWLYNYNTMPIIKFKQACMQGCSICQQQHYFFMVLTHHKIHFNMSCPDYHLNNIGSFFNQHSIMNCFSIVFSSQTLSSSFSMLQVLVNHFITPFSTYRAVTRFMNYKDYDHRTQLLIVQPLSCLLFHYTAKLNKIGLKLMKVIRSL